MNKRNGLAPMMVVVILAVIAIVASSAFYFRTKPAPTTNPAPTPSAITPVVVGQQENVPPSTTTVIATTEKVKIALLAGPAKDEDAQHLQGCDIVVFKEIQVPPTTMPLTAALKELFARREPWPYTETAAGNFISKEKTLSFDHATIENGTAKIYLNGSYSLSGVCDDPRIEVQLRNTAMQFPSVHATQIFLNNSPFVTPSERG